MAVTIKDIARLANVSHTTVSRALNGSPLIKEETRRRIMEIADQMSYTPNYNAKSLVLQKSHTIGVFFTSIASGTSSSFLADTMKGVSGVIDVNYNLFVRGIDDYTDFSSIHGKRFDGIVLMSQSDSDDAFIYHARSKGIPLVVLNREVKAEGICNILSDDRDGAYLAGRHLIDSGHERIGLIEGRRSFKSAAERRDGLLRAMIESHLPINGECIVPGDYTTQGGYEAMRALLDLDTPPTAVFCANDDTAIGAMNAVFERGLRVPDDISIVGFDDIGFSSYTNPALTTVKRPIERISRRGAQTLVEWLRTGIAPPQETIRLHTELIVRKSVEERR
ncbi:LacI family DNA-binding transcriptional regulator [Saccharibacillus sp. CPCC 101409]|uniref:LacI family DNA-binding transcriptional regulator n=1 Tax=Saccharibacillus sp. CPCC 101409 TaxID=3058041 RepID=UPI0026710D15|nr:LacI family DNA-binding transcriptional regulator [Saccharibacillus sp. CPCC 101409]MDO3410791.1 LacI family DNA-binding transcriptional regulator [Saccharibacillus sp. CPCC 101409]